MNWRPDDWNEIKDNLFHRFGMIRTCIDSMSCEAGASAMLSALLKWLFEPCNLHEYQYTDDWENGVRIKGARYYHKHRYLCPQCMAELKERNEQR